MFYVRDEFAGNTQRKAYSVAKFESTGVGNLKSDFQLPAFYDFLTFLVVISRGSHPFPSRTRKLSPAEPMILHG